MAKKKRKQKARNTSPRHHSSTPVQIPKTRTLWPWFLLAIPALIFLWAMLPGTGSKSEDVSEGFEVITRMPHDPEAYTQGFLYDREFFYESTGLYGYSTVRKVDPASGRVVRRIALEDRLFGEGLALLNGMLYQLTWTSGEAIVYDVLSFTEVRRFRYSGQGWGLTTDGRSLIMSDGSQTLTFRSPHDFSVERTLLVRGDGAGQINELEYIRGEIWANVYQSSMILRISPETGLIIGRLDLSVLPFPEEQNGNEDVLNGIAYDAGGDRIFVTGKNYSYVYEIRVSDDSGG